jgi:hypothetical protein
MRLAGLTALCALLQACSGAAEPAEQQVPSFPADYGASYVEVRDCRKSADHELEFIRVLADSMALAPYRDRAGAFPDGAVVLKEQYDPADDTCAGPIMQWTVMTKRAAASEHLGWDFQRVTADRRVVETNTASCSGCHQSCSGTPTGYDSTCADP